MGESYPPPKDYGPQPTGIFPQETEDGDWGDRKPRPGPEAPPTRPYDRKTVGLPPRNFLYTPDQIAGIIGVQLESVLIRYLYYEGRDVGYPDKSRMIARNIAPEDQPPEWRVAEGELIRWMRKKGFKFYERASISPH